jgi:hypothetical protein
VDGKQAPSAIGSIKVQIYRKETIDDVVQNSPTTETSSSGTTHHGSGSGSGNGDSSRDKEVTQQGSGSGNGNGDMSGDKEVAQHGSGSGSGNGDGEASCGGEPAEGTDVNSTLSDLGVVQRDPDFVNFPTWQDLNRRIDSGILPLPFEIG